MTIPRALVGCCATPAELATLTAAERAVLRRVERDVAEASIGTAFDLRHVLRLDGAARERWLAERAEWIAALLAGDPRVR